MSKLTPKQEQFCREYLIDLNATQACIRAGYEEKTSAQQGSRLLSNAKIQAFVQSINEKRQEKTETDAAWVLRRLRILAEFNINKFIKKDERGNAVYDFSTATDDDWYCISEYTTEEIHRGAGDDVYVVDKIKIKTVDKLKAIELAGKHVSIQAFNEKTTVEIVDKSSILSKARKRAEQQ